MITRASENRPPHRLSFHKMRCDVARVARRDRCGQCDSEAKVVHRHGCFAWHVEVPDSVDVYVELGNQLQPAISARVATWEASACTPSTCLTGPSSAFM